METTTVETPQTDRAAWLKERRKGIGASESAALFGEHPYISLLRLWEMKVNDKPVIDEDEDDRRADGLLMEPRIAARYARKTGRVVRMPAAKLVTHPQYPFLVSSPDRIVEFDAIGEEEPLSEYARKTGPLELKWWDHFQKGDPVPTYGQIQLQQQLACLGAERGSFAVLGSFRSFYWFDAERNQKFIDLLVEKAHEFWDRHVLAGTPPTADGSDATAEALRRLYPRDNSNTVQLPEQALDWLSDWLKAKAEREAAEEREAAAQNKLKLAIADATFGRLTNGQMLSLKTTEKAAYTATFKATSYRTLRIVGKGGKK